MEVNAVSQELLLKFEHILNPRISKEQRIEADAFIQQVKKEKHLFMSVMNNILIINGAKIQESPGLLILALTCLNDWIKIWWNKLERQEKEELKGFVLELLLVKSVSSLSLSQVPTVRTLIAVAVSSIAERQFPQQWSSLVEDMVKLWIASPPKVQEIVLKILDTIWTFFDIF